MVLSQINNEAVSKPNSGWFGVYDPESDRIIIEQGWCNRCAKSTSCSRVNSDSDACIFFYPSEFYTIFLTRSYTIT